jgi:hypothetical protein
MANQLTTNNIKTEQKTTMFSRILTLIKLKNKATEVHRSLSIVTLVDPLWRQRLNT